MNLVYLMKMHFTSNLYKVSGSEFKSIQACIDWILETIQEPTVTVKDMKVRNESFLTLISDSPPYFRQYLSNFVYQYLFKNLTVS
jgi:hypothetical protein